MKASIQALENIAKEMKKKGIQKIAMVGKTDPSTVDKMKAMDGIDSEESNSMDSMMADMHKSKSDEETSMEEESAAHEAMPGDPKEDAAEGEPHDDQAFKDKLALVRKLLRGQ